MSVAHARSLVAGWPVQLQPYTPLEDTDALLKLARWMLRFAPVVSPDQPDGLFLDIAGCANLFGGEFNHARRIVRALQAWGLRPRLAVAPTFACARAVARYGREPISLVDEDSIGSVMAPFPIHALRIDEDIIDSLHDVGIERIESLMALPRDELAARFGKTLLHRLDEVTGAVSETIDSVNLLRQYESSYAFDGPVKRIEAIEATTQELLTRLLAQLQESDRGVLELTVELRRVDLGPEVRSIRLTYPSRDHTHLWKMLWPQLGRAHLGFGVEEITLRAVRTHRMLPQQSVFLRDAVSEAAQPAALGELIDRLRDRNVGFSKLVRNLAHLITQ